MKQLKYALKKCCKYCLGAIVFLALGPHFNANSAEQQELKEAYFQILTNQSIFEPDSSVMVKFVILNRRESPLYVPRTLSNCTSVEGSFSLQILAWRFIPTVKRESMAA